METYSSTKQEIYTKNTTINKIPYKFTITDTVNNETYSSKRDQEMANNNAFLLVYSVTDPSSFAEISNFRSKILKVKRNEETPIVIVGNKIDLESERKVSFEEGEILALSFTVKEKRKKLYNSSESKR